MPLSRISPVPTKAIGGLESTVRPFVNSPPRGQRSRFLSSSDVASEPVSEPSAGLIIRWQAKAETVEVPPGKYTQLPPPIDGPDEPEPVNAVELHEFDREVHVKRIESPDDPEVWVEVEVIDRISFIEATSKTRYTFILNNP